MNVYKRFLELLPQRPLLVGKVTAMVDGVATIEQPGGFTSQARGEAQVGDRVFFRDETIEGPAPNLPLVFVEE